ncbi:hypothetical protein KAX75_04850, partial [candidate division WOR-3 bacterium]|nr:hypothetical protein [candidate division WOR-3 bacterium]
EIEIEVKPMRRFDAGAGRGIPVKKTVNPGILGIFCDMRERPISPDRELITEWRKIISRGKNG